MGIKRESHLTTLLRTLFLLLCMGRAEYIPDATRDGIPAVKEWAKYRADNASAAFPHPRLGSPATWANETVYSIVVDRFNNGDLSNDRNNVKDEHQREYFGGSGDLTNLPNWRHGGDLQGIINRLNYLANLGVTTLWITPIFQHDGSYHAYCTTDLTRVDSGFGTNALFQKLVYVAHSLGLKVVLDIVINHLCDVNTHYSKEPSHTGCANDLNTAYWEGQSAVSPNQGELAFASSFFPPFKSKYFFNACGTDNQGEMAGEGPAAIFGDFASGMFDYNTLNYDFQEIFADLVNFWIGFADIDGVRLDAAKHVTADFLAYLSTSARDYALRLGKRNFLVLGEVAASEDWIARRLGFMQTDPHEPDSHGAVPASLTGRIKTIQSTYLAHPTQAFPGLSSVYNFYLSGTTKDTVLQQKAPQDLMSYLDSQFYKTVSPESDMTILWNCLEIHDWPRFLSSAPRDFTKLRSGFGILFSLPGAPILYYGVEQAFNGMCNFNRMNAGQATGSIQDACESGSDAVKRQDFWHSSPWKLDSALPEMYNESYIGYWNPAVDSHDPYLTLSLDWGTTLRQFIALRKACSCLQTGGLRFTYLVNSVIAFSRFDETMEIITVVNLGSSWQDVYKVPIDSSINRASGQVYRNAFDFNQVGYVGFENSQTYLYLPNIQIHGNSVFIFIHEANLRRDDRLGFSVCTR